MKKIFVVFVALFALFTFTGCNVGAGEFEPTNQLAKNGRIVSVCGEHVGVNVGGDVFEFEGTNYHVGEEVKVFFDVNGEPTNPWVWWVIDCKPLH
jgi:hypothetical protein